MLFGLFYVVTWVAFAVVPNNETKHQRDLKQQRGY